MVGACCALALAQGGASVAVLEMRRPASWLAGDDYHLRVSAISPPSRRILQSLGVWESILEARAKAYIAMHVWDEAGQATLDFSRDDYPELSELGHIVENDLVLKVLWEGLAANENVHVFDCAWQELERNPDQLELTLETGECLQARLLVAADGKSSRMREEAGIPVRVHDYRQQAIVATVKPGSGHHDTAWQCFHADGPVALLPLQDGKASIVWSTTPEKAAELLAMDDSTFESELNLALGGKFNGISLLSERAAFPLQMQRAASYISHRLALAGDAAHVIHPLAGQGVNLGFLDAAALSELVLVELQRKADPGSSMVLNRYQRWRKGDNLLTQELMTVLRYLFAAENPVLARVRSLGMQIVNKTELKHIIASHVLRVNSDHPDLAR